MSTVTSCPFLSGGRLSAMPAVSSPGGRLSKKPAAVVSLSSEGKSRPLSVCFVTPKGGEYNPKLDLPAFSISPVELVNPKPVAGERWQVEEKRDAVTLWFDVPGLSKEDLAVEIDEDVLIIKKKDVPKSNTTTSNSSAAAAAAAGKNNAVNSATAAAVGDGGRVYARLLLPAAYTREGVQAELSSGELKVTIAKVRESARRRINVEIAVK